MSDTPRATGLVRILLPVLLFALVSPSSFGAGSIAAQLTTAQKQQLQEEARMVVDLLQNHHRSGRTFREIENKEMVTRFIEELDPDADYFTTDDIAFIHRRFDRTLKSVYLFRGDLQPAFEIFDLFAERFRTRLGWIQSRLEQDFDLTVEDTYTDDPKPQPSAPGAATELRWERRLKNDLLRELIAGRSLPEAREAVNKNHVKTGRDVAAVDAFVVRERFFDAIIRSFDPHSGYFSADSAREFAVDMENAVTGLGLDLRKEAGACVVSALQPGGPADLHSDIAPGDILLAVAEGDGPWIDAAAARLREIVALIRGAIGAKVRLAYSPAGTTDRIEITLERTRIILGGDRVHGAISDVPDSAGRIRHIGWVTLPNFYTGGTGTEKSSAAADLRELIDRMVGAGIEGLVLDLRANPGGALTEAVAISQLFLPHGLVMLSRGLDVKITEHALKPEPVVYGGPLVVLTSPQSASASEIFSGAMKFHRRAIIVGAAATFGKGTSQAYIALGQLPGRNSTNARDWGTLRLTTEQFYVPSGQSVQQTGIASDIVLPEADLPGFKREVELPHALPAETIASTAVPAITATRAAVTDPLRQHLRQRATQDFETMPEWDLWRRERGYAKAEFARRTSRPLQLAARQREWATRLGEFQVNQRLRRTLDPVSAYPTQPFEIPLVQAILDQHETKLRALREPGTNEPVLHQLHRGAFYVATDQGHLRAIRLNAIEPITYYGDTATLAAAFTAATSHPLTAAQTHEILQAIELLDPRTESALLATIGRITGGNLDGALVRRGTEALLRRMSELDDDWSRTRPSLDVPLREALRLTAAWAESLTPPPAPPSPVP